MVINDKQLLKLISIAQYYMLAIKEDSEKDKSVIRNIALLLHEIEEQQSEELKVIQ